MARVRSTLREGQPGGVHRALVATSGVPGPGRLPMISSLRADAFIDGPRETGSAGGIEVAPGASAEAAR